MLIAPLDLSADRARLLEFVEARTAEGLPGLSENKHALLVDPGERPGGGLVASEGAEIGAYVGLAPSQVPGEWAMEMVTAGPDFPVGPLVDAAVEAVSERGASRLRWWVYGSQMASVPGRHGFVPERELLVMGRGLPAPAPEFPDGVEVRGFRPGIDDAAWLEANNAAFAGHPENGDQTDGDLRRRMAMDWFDPEGLRAAWVGEEMAGFCWTKIHGRGEGEIYIIGVVPAFQGIGLGKALVLEGMSHLADAGCRRVFLYTEGDNSAAVGLYRRLGMEIEQRHRSFIRSLEG